MKFILAVLTSSIFFFYCACGRSKGLEKKETKEVEMLEIEVYSSSFKNGGVIPKKYTCEGEDISPHIGWGELPKGVKSLALICDDPDAPGGDFVHWVIYNIPPEIDSLPEGLPIKDTLDFGALQGMTDFGRVGYGGPCPPRGPAHHYHFKLYALDTVLDAEKEITKEKLLKKMEGHILAKGEIVGLFNR
ncbi:MAG: YbhB/YbcL family Raf kinase inhibitor-like protein [candidate division WOR-3 bacterium]